MDEAEMERLAEKTRAHILRIWNGDAERADKFLCLIIRYYKDHSSDISPGGRDRVLMRLMQLMQR